MYLPGGDQSGATPNQGAFLLGEHVTEQIQSVRVRCIDQRDIVMQNYVKRDETRPITSVCRQTLDVKVHAFRAKGLFIHVPTHQFSVQYEGATVWIQTTRKHAG